MRRTVISVALAAAAVAGTFAFAAPANACYVGNPPRFGEIGDCIDRTLDNILP